MRLSKKGWNNVLIFGVLLIIFVFNFSQELRLTNTALQRTVISPELTIVEIQTPDYTIKRVGRDWMKEPSGGISEETLPMMVSYWQTVPLDSLTIDSLPTSNFILKFFVLEQSQPIIVQLHQQANDQYIIQVNENSFLLLPAEKLSAFIGI